MFYLRHIQFTISILFLSLTSYSQINGVILNEKKELFRNTDFIINNQIIRTDLLGKFQIEGMLGDTLYLGDQMIIVDQIPLTITTESSIDRMLEITEIVIREKRSKNAEIISLNSETLSHYRGSSNGDVFHGIPSLQLNNIRNEANALDIGIRGFQGEGRVPIIIDNGIQSTQTNRGYQGTSDRTYIEMDFVKEVNVYKGGSNLSIISGNTAGYVKMKTLSPGDIVKPKTRFGAKVKIGLSNNYSHKKAPNKNLENQYYILDNRIKPSEFNGHHASLIVAYQKNKLGLLLAGNVRNQGNYFAGSKGASKYGYNPLYYDTLIPEQIKHYRFPEVRPNQEVVNTAYYSKSMLAKINFEVFREIALSANYRHHHQRAGEVLSAYWYKNITDSTFQKLPKGTESMPQWILGTTNYNFYNIDGKWQRNQWINLTLNSYSNQGNFNQYNGLAQILMAENGDQYRHQYSNMRKGIHLDNKMIFTTLPLVMNISLSHNNERMKPHHPPKGRLGSARNGYKKSFNARLATQWKVKNLIVQYSLKLQRSKISDLNTEIKQNYAHKLDHFARADFFPFEWINTYAKYSINHRSPSLYEGTNSLQSFSFDPEYPLKYETMKSFDIGFTLDILRAIQLKDSLAVSLSYFNNNSKNYISAGYLPNEKLSFINYDYFKNSGIEINLNFRHRFGYIITNAIFYQEPKICSKILGAYHEIEACNSTGFDFSVIPNRIPPKQSVTITTGIHLFKKRCEIGGRFKYHTKKSNPAQWLMFTGAAGIAVEIPEDHNIDIYLQYLILSSLKASIAVNNLTNRYQFDVGTVIRMPNPGRTITFTLEYKF